MAMATRDVLEWHSFLFDERAKSSDTLHMGLRSIRKTLGHLNLGQLNPNQGFNEEREAKRVGELAQAMGRETFAGLYAPAPGTELVTKAHEILESLPEYQALKQQVHGDPDLSAIAAGSLLQGAAEGLAAFEREQKKEQRQQQAGGRGGVAADPEGAMRRAMRSAVEGAAQESAEVQDSLNALSPGLGHAPPTHEQDDGGQRCRLAERIRYDENFKKVMQMAGRFRRISQNSDRKVRDEQGSSTLVGVRMGGDIHLALPSELGLMRHPMLRRLQLAKLADRRLQQYHVVGETTKGRGPVVVLLDESGSMRGERAMWASAVAIACLGTAAKEKRPCTIIGFNGGVKYTYQLDKQGKAWEHRIDPEGHKTGEPVSMGSCVQIAMAVAAMQARGGTHFDPPVTAALNLEDGLTSERSDLVLVTDGRATVSEGLLSRLANARENCGLRVFGLTIGGGTLSQAVTQICDEAFDMDAIIAEGNESQAAACVP